MLPVGQAWVKLWVKRFSGLDPGCPDSSGSDPIYEGAATGGRAPSRAARRDRFASKLRNLPVPTRIRREVVNYFAALRHVEKQAAKKRLTHEDVLRLHGIIAGEVMEQGEAGRYRTLRVRVGAYVPPPPEEVSGLMFEFLVEWWNKDSPVLSPVLS